MPVPNDSSSPQPDVRPADDPSRLPDPAAALARALAVVATDGAAAALPLFEAAARSHPAHPPARLNLGVALAQTGRPHDALAELDAAVRLDPAYAEGHFNRGNVLRDLGRVDEGVAAFREAARLRPDHAGAHNNLGLAVLDAGRPDEAAVLLAHAARLQPHVKEAHNNLGLALADLGRWADAEAAYGRALGIDPVYAEAHANLAGAWRGAGRTGEAVAGYDLAVRLAPDAPAARYNRSLALLAAGDWPRGFAEYEWRWRRPAAPPRTFAAPRWAGEDVSGKTVLLWCEQGLGDAVQFVRFARSVKALGATTVVECPPPLAVLFAASGVADVVVAEGQPPPPYDAQCPLMSVPAVLGTTPDTVPAAAYLAAAPDRVAYWREHLASLGGGPVVGVCWQGNPRHRWDRFRSRPLAAVARAAATLHPGGVLVSLQQGHGAEQLARWRGPPTVHPLPSEAYGLRPFEESAALVAGLDAVVTVDTAAAHVAGALGAPVAILLSRPTDWRWADAGEYTPWYPSATLVRDG